MLTWSLIEWKTFSCAAFSIENFVTLKSAIGNKVNNIVIAIYGTRWRLELSEGTCCNLYERLSTALYT